LGWLRKLYLWVVQWAETPYSNWALFLLAFCESSFFPIPPDVLLITLAVAKPKRSFIYSLNCSVGSVLGGLLGYFIGYQFMELFGRPILQFYGMMDDYLYIQKLYSRYEAWAVGIAGFTPIPYKAFTITAGAFRVDLAVFLLASMISRSARFFLVGGLMYLFGESIRVFIEKYFNILTIIFVILLMGGFIIIKWLL